MRNMEELEDFLLEDQNIDYFTVLNNTSIYQYNVSTQRASNASSQILLEEVWKTNRSLLKDKSDEFLKFVNVDSSSDTNNAWKSNLSKSIDPIALFKQSLPTCTICAQDTPKFTGMDQIIRNKCVCKINIPGKYQSSNQQNKRETESITTLISDCHNGDTQSTKERQITRQKFNHPKVRTTNKLTSKCPPVDHEMELQNEDETKAHQINVAKITFKTAKEQLLASNPAAKRTLGTSRKAQAKFVSPMIGAQEKQENCEQEVTDERLKHIDPKMIELIESEIIYTGTPIVWEDIAGLQMAKSVIQEAVVWPLLRPDIFKGLRRPPKGILLFGPPGTGKTLIGKCIAAQCNATFFSISASSLTSKWIGDGEKMVRALFAVARCRQPAVVFIDEIDSLLTQRNDTEHEATRRIKTEFLVQFDGAGTGEEDRLLIVGATNRPHELDEAARRRLVKRLYIPLPDVEARKQIICNLLKNEKNNLSNLDTDKIAQLSEGYSGADMKELCSEAAMGPVRAVPLSQIVTIDTNKVRPVNVEDFKNALQRVRPSVSQDDLGQYVKWNKTYGQGF